MVRVIQSNVGTFNFKNVMIDINGTDLVGGIDVHLDNKHIGEVVGNFDLENHDGDKLAEIGHNLNYLH